MTALTKKAFLGLGMAALVFFVSCNEDADPPASGIDDATIEAESLAQSDFEEVDDITTSIMGIVESSSGGRIANVEDDRCHCAEVTHDKENHTIKTESDLFLFFFINDSPAKRLRIPKSCKV